MTELFNSSLFAGAVAFAVSVILTLVVRRLAHHYGFVAKPKSDRWHKRTTAMMGGVAIFLSTVATALLFGERSRELFVILAGGTFLFLVGLLDDLLNIKPYQKLIGQFIGVGIVTSGGLILGWTDSQLINIAITGFWLIGITNAINLLDNMDGLAAGIAAIAAVSLGLGFGASGQFPQVILVSVFVGALAGFLVFNFNPASVFMGDCGSMFVGFFLASSVLLTDVGGRSRSLFLVLAVPALILFVPIFDTTFVTILRKLAGRKASQGGRDHTSHRLVALGLSERAAVLMLYGFAALAGILSLLVRELALTQSLALIVLFILVLTFVGVYLGKVKVYEEQDEELALRNHAVFGFLINLSYKRRVFEVILDAFLIALSYYAAHILIFGSFEQSETWELFIKSLPILIVVKLFAFLVAGVYRGLWRYTSVKDFFTFLKGIALGSVLCVIALLFLYRFQNFSRAVFVVDALLLLTAFSASRIAFRVFRQMLPSPANKTGRRTLIYGAGDGGELILRELHNNPEWNYNPVGFIDDDPLKIGKVIHGLRVFGGSDALGEICRRQEIEEILLTSRKFSAARIKEIREQCDDAEVSLKRAALTIESIDYE